MVNLCVRLLIKPIKTSLLTLGLWENGKNPGSTAGGRAGPWVSDSSILQYTAPSVLPFLASGLEKSVGAGGRDECLLAATAQSRRGAAAAGGFFAGEWFRCRMRQLREFLSGVVFYREKASSYSARLWYLVRM